MARYCFLDTETTGTDPELHAVWEIGLIVRDRNADEQRDTDSEYLWMVEPDLKHANSVSLQISRYYERIPLPHVDPLPTTGADSEYQPIAYNLASDDAPNPRLWSDPGATAGQLARLLNGATVFGAVPDFDTRFLHRFLQKNGQALAADYHLVDIECVIAGALLGMGHLEPDVAPMMAVTAAPPWKSSRLYDAIGLRTPADAVHTALGDARAVRDAWDLLHQPTERADG